MFLVAVTGGIATGKSTVTKVFRDNGVAVIDADLIARQGNEDPLSIAVVDIGQPAYREIKGTFGEEVLKDNGEINRDALGKIVFNDRELRGKLNQITHPRIHRKIVIEIVQNLLSGKRYVVLDLPLLFETGILIDFIHKIITVTCADDLQVQRLMKRSNLSEEDARKRIQAQMPLEIKCQRSHFVIENSGDYAVTEKETLKILNILDSSKHYWRIRFYIILGCSVLVGFLCFLGRIYNLF